MLQSRIWELSYRQHGVVARRQLLELGLDARTVDRRVASGRLHVLWRGVYAVGRPQVERRGWWLAAVLACGPMAALSHWSAAALWRILQDAGLARIDVSVPCEILRRRPGIALHRRSSFGPLEVTNTEGIPVTSPICTLVDIAADLPARRLEATVNEAVKLGLFQYRDLRPTLARLGTRRGTAALRRMLRRDSFKLTDSVLERRFLPLARRAGLTAPETRAHVNGFRVDFFWPDLGLVVETDGLRFHRTPSQQAADRRRDQAHAMAGMTPLRFTHAQVTYEPGYVVAALDRVAARLRAAPPRGH
jgi:very-short-patch-repair endonuclease